jgi:hypothetical protein
MTSRDVGVKVSIMYINCMIDLLEPHSEPALMLGLVTLDNRSRGLERSGVSFLGNHGAPRHPNRAPEKHLLRSTSEINLITV